jgi:hypothetical protein
MEQAEDPSRLLRTAARLEAKGIKPNTFVLRNVGGISKNHDFCVFDDYTQKLCGRSPVD